MYDETAGTQEALETQGDGTSPDETNVLNEGEEEIGQDNEQPGALFPDTPAPDRPIPQPQAHRGVITSVTAEVAPNTGTQFLKFGWKSKETGNDDNLAIWLPQAYAINPMVDSATLSDEQPIKEDGTKGMSERAKYARAVRNSKGNGTIESIVKLAIEQGHQVSLPQPRTFNQLASYLNALCVGTEIVATMRAEGGDGDYADRLRTSAFVGFEYASSQKALKNYRKLWQEGQ